MKTFLQRFYDYIFSPEGFNCVNFTYNGVVYQVSEGHFICYTDTAGQEHTYQFPKDIDVLLDANVLQNGKSLRDIWSTSGENDLLPEFY